MGDHVARPNRRGWWRIIWPSGKRGDRVFFSRCETGELSFTLPNLDEEEAGRWLSVLNAGALFEYERSPR